MLHRFEQRGLNFSYYDNQADGPVILFQHGLTGDHVQTRGTFTDLNYRLITLDCRGHGTSDLGPVSELSISTFADDVAALMQHLALERVSIAGISMGAAMCCVLAARHPEKISSVTLVRPAFHAKRMPAIQQVHSIVANYIDVYGTQKGMEYFRQSEIFEEILKRSPDNANSLLAMFRMDPNRTIPLLKMMTIGDTGFNAELLRQSGIPFKVIGTIYDEIHPLEKAEMICRDLGVESVDICYPKSLNREAYNRDVTNFIKSNVF
jgi:pimeloyl-ACP methyl ester carboxylesterase